MIGSKKKSILFIFHSPFRGGAELASLELLKGFVKKGFSCSVLVSGKGFVYEELKNLKLDNIYFVDLPWWILNDGLSKDELLKKIINSSVEVLEILIENKFDFVYTNTCVIPQGAIASFILGIPHIWHIHEFGEKDHSLKFLLDFEERAKFLDKTSSKIILNSKALKKDFDEVIDNKKSIVSYYNIELPKVDNNSKIDFFRNKDFLKLLLIGQIKSGKGQFIVVEAIKYFIDNFGKKIELVIVGNSGDNNYFENLKKFISDNNLGEIISIHNFVNNPTSLFESADVVLMSSFFEAFGRVTVEAMMCGKPVIGSNSGATPEIVKNNFSGLLFGVGNFIDLANKINFFYKDKTKILEYGVNAKNFVRENYSDKNYSDLISSILLSEYNKIEENKEIFNAENFVGNMFLNLKDYLNLKNTEIKQKTEEINSLKNELNSKLELEYAIKNQNEELKLEKEVFANKIDSLKSEIEFIKSSKFWKVRESYVKYKNKVKWAIFCPKKFISKYFLN